MLRVLTQRPEDNVSVNVPNRNAPFSINGKRSDGVIAQGRKRRFRMGKQEEMKLKNDWLAMFAHCQVLLLLSTCTNI